MEWNNKYNYPKSTRSIVDGSRHYSVNEERLPSVTTILKATESEEKKSISSSLETKGRPKAGRNYYS